MEFRLLCASLDRANYQTVVDQLRERNQLFVCPDRLSLEVQTWQTDSAPTLAYILMPDKCEQHSFRAANPLTDDEAAYLFNLLQV